VTDPEAPPANATVRPFERIVRAIETNLVLFVLVNILVSAVWAYYALQGLAFYEAVEGYPVRRIAALLMTTNSGLLILFFVLRRRSRDWASDPASVAFGHIGTWLPVLPLAFPDTAGSPHEALAEPCMVILAVSLAISTLGILSLGRSWGIIPANRGIKTRGLYALVRHPIYANYMIFYADYALVRFSPVTVFVAVAMPVAIVARAVFEERVLMRDPEYVAYAARVRYRFFPGIF